jgi:O-Antigen ligase
LAKNSSALTALSAPSLSLMVFIVILFAIGGSSRDDEMQTAILQPVSIVFCALGLYFLFRNAIVNSGTLVLLVAAVTMLALIHVVPLPPALWQALPNQSLVLDIDSSVGIGNGWRPLSLSPNLGWGSALSMIAAFSVALLAHQLDKNERWLLLPVLIALSSVSGLIGLLQSVGNSNGPLYFYQVTNNDSAVGLLANRNHAATLLACIFPMLAAFSSTTGGEAPGRNSRQIWNAAIALVTVPLILVTGSRAGFLVGLIGLVGAGLIYRPAKPNLRNAKSIKPYLALRRNLIAGLLILGLACLTFFVSRAKALDRLFELTPGEDGRFSFVRAAANLALEYLPFGTGSGSFADVYKMVEVPSGLSAVYVNHAHNDWVETALTFGAPGVLLMTLTVVIYIVQTYLLWRFGNPARRSITLARMASICLFILAIASLSDYPLRTPLLLCLAILLITMLFSVNAKSLSKAAPT